MVRPEKHVLQFTQLELLLLTWHRTLRSQFHGPTKTFGGRPRIGLEWGQTRCLV